MRVFLFPFLQTGSTGISCGEEWRGGIDWERSVVALRKKNKADVKSAWEESKEPWWVVEGIGIGAGQDEARKDEQGV